MQKNLVLLTSNTGGSNFKKGEEKRQRLLQFLAGGESWTDCQTTQALLQCSESSALRTINALIKNRLLVVEKHQQSGCVKNLYGITPAGCSMAGCSDQSRFQLGRLNSGYISHQLLIQKARLRAEGAGWVDWKPGRFFYKKGFKKVPDAVAEFAGIKFAIELERTIKTSKRYGEIVQAHIEARAAGHWREVVYILPDEKMKARLKAIFSSIKFIRWEGQKVSITEEKLFQIFKFETINNFPSNNLLRS